MNEKVTVDATKKSYYHAPKVGTTRDRLQTWLKQLSYRQYHSMLLRYAELSVNSSGELLEVGCGPGYLISFLEKWFPKMSITGFEYDQRLIEEAKERVQRISFIQGNAEELPFSDCQFDVMVSLHLIEHLYNPEKMLQEVHRVLKPNGIFIVATPNLGGLGARVMGEKWSGFREDHVSLKSSGDWSKLIACNEFVSLMENTTFLSGIPIFTKFPLGIINYGCLLIFGSFPWELGEAYIAVWRKK
jgi:SAM-dependent methyltransferase